MPSPPALHVLDYVGPVLGAALFVLVMSLVREPARRTFNAVLAAGACAVYLSGGLGVWELLFPALAAPVVYLGLRSHRFIGIAWLMHAAWDLVHHLYGNPIWPFMPTSSFGCLIFDSLIAIWFLAGAPTLLPRGVRGRDPAGSGETRHAVEEAPKARSRDQIADGRCPGDSVRLAWLWPVGRVPSTRFLGPGSRAPPLVRCDGMHAGNLGAGVVETAARARRSGVRA